MNLVTPPALNVYSADYRLLQRRPPLRGKLADRLSHYAWGESLRGIRLLVVDAQLQQLWANDTVPEMKLLLEHLGAAIALAEKIDWQPAPAPHR